MSEKRRGPGGFSEFAQAASTFAGRPLVFVIAISATVVWLATGYFYNFSDTWQLVASTATSVITFLMVFLIQNSQNREMRALQLKLSELIFAVHGAHDKLADVETFPEAELNRLSEEVRARADQVTEELKQESAEIKETERRIRARHSKKAAQHNK